MRKALFFLLMPMQALADIYRNFFYKRDPLALTAMLVFMTIMVFMAAVQLKDNQFFRLGIGIVSFGFFVAFPAFVYLIDRGYIGGRSRRATDKLFGPRKANRR